MVGNLHSRGSVDIQRIRIHPLMGFDQRFTFSNKYRRVNNTEVSIIILKILYGRYAFELYILVGSRTLFRVYSQVMSPSITPI